jgi:hypothetical protein
MERLWYNRSISSHIVSYMPTMVGNLPAFTTFITTGLRTACDGIPRATVVGSSVWTWSTKHTKIIYDDRVPRSISRRLPLFPGLRLYGRDGWEPFPSCSIPADQCRAQYKIFADAVFSMSELDTSGVMDLLKNSPFNLTHGDIAVNLLQKWYYNLTFWETCPQRTGFCEQDLSLEELQCAVMVGRFQMIYFEPDESSIESRDICGNEQFGTQKRVDLPEIADKHTAHLTAITFTSREFNPGILDGDPDHYCK